MSALRFDVGEVQTRLQAAAPDGWYVRPISVERDLAPRMGYPSTIYRAEALARRPVGKRGAYVVARSLDVEIRAATIEALEEAVRALPALDAFLALPLDTEVRLASSDD